MRPPTLALVTVASLALGATFFARSGDAAPAADTRAPLTVRTVSASSGAAVQEIRLSGITRARQRAALSFTVAGRLEQRSVQVGDRVERGQALARLDRRPLRHGVAAARADLESVAARLAQGRRDADRAARLRGEDALSVAELEGATSQVDTLSAGRSAAETAVSEAQRLLDEATLVAPFAGIVRDVGLEAGEYATPGRTIVVLDGDAGIELEVEVPEVLLADLHEGAEVRVELPRQSLMPLVGRVRAIGRAAGGGGRLFPVIVELPAIAGLVPGVTAELVVERRREGTLAVPVEGVIDPGGQRPAVFVVRDGVAHRLEIDVDHVSEGRAFVHGPVREGDAVVVTGHAGLIDGIAVAPAAPVPAAPSTRTTTRLAAEVTP